MDLPFTQQQFLEVLRRYNEGLMPLQVGLLVLGLAAVAGLNSGGRASGPASGRSSGRMVSGVLACLWLWMGLVYHLGYFREINPAATLFAWLSIGGAVAFAWHGVFRRRLAFDTPSRGRRVAGHLLILYGLLGYPLLSLLLGRESAETPTFGLPCPTTIFTLGVLAFLSGPFPLWVFAAPLLWAVIGLQAAVFLGMHEDLGLLAALAVGLWTALGRTPVHRRAL